MSDRPTACTLPPWGWGKRLSKSELDILHAMDEEQTIIVRIRQWELGNESEPFQPETT